MNVWNKGKFRVEDPTRVGRLKTSISAKNIAVEVRDVDDSRYTSSQLATAVGISLKSRNEILKKKPSLLLQFPKYVLYR